MWLTPNAFSSTLFPTSLLLPLWITFLLSLGFWLLWQKHQAESHPQASHQKYLGYFLFSASHLDEKLLLHEEHYCRQLTPLLKQLSDKKSLNSPYHLALLQASFLLGQVYRFYQPHLRLSRTLEKKTTLSPDDSLNPLQETLQLSLSQTETFFQALERFLLQLSPEIESLPPQNSPTPLLLAPPSIPPLQQLEELPLSLKEALQELQVLQQRIQPVWTEELTVAEWLVMDDHAKTKVAELQLHCFHCALRDYETIAQAATLHPFDLKQWKKKMLLDSEELLDPPSAELKSGSRF
jgi:hypothetical protein